MAGYYGYKMSNNAVDAYSNGEKPMSKWTKEELLESLSIKQQEFAKKLTASELRNELLIYSSWHHTSSYYNRTDFYMIDEEAVENLTQQRVQDIIAKRVPKTRVNKEVEPNNYVIAFVEYTEYVGSRKHPKKVTYREIIKFRSQDKMVVCKNSESYQKRLSSLTILKKIEQKTKFASEEKLIALCKKDYCTKLYFN